MHVWWQKKYVRWINRIFLLIRPCRHPKLRQNHPFRPQAHHRSSPCHMQRLGERQPLPLVCDGCRPCAAKGRQVGESLWHGAPGHPADRRDQELAHSACDARQHQNLVDDLVSKLPVLESSLGRSLTVLGNQIHPLRYHNVQLSRLYPVEHVGASAVAWQAQIQIRIHRLRHPIPLLLPWLLLMQLFLWLQTYTK